MKRVIIVHCWDGYPEYCWYPQTKKELEAKGFQVSIPAMPETEEPKLSLWLPTLQEVIGTPDEDLYLIGHSAGCITIMRYLETLLENQKIGGVVFVAGFTDNLGFDELTNFFETPIDFEKIKTKAKHFIAIASDNDPFVPLKHADILKEKLGAEVTIKHDMQHFSGEVDNEESCTSLPDVISAIEEMVKN
ncbi:MAG TPA: alpha/beta hydrolase [Candidatus Saccharimonadales bacterium]|nr:alpha/beta hydrolase [Candidatus Saccharimonadales bacterium]